MESKRWDKWTGSQIRQKSNSFLSSTGYPTQRQNKLAYSREKAPKEEIKFPTVHTLRETYGYCLEPVCSQILIPCSNCPALEQPVRPRGVLKEEPQDKWSCQLLGPYLQIPQLSARHEWQGKSGQSMERGVARTRNSDFIQKATKPIRRWTPKIHLTWASNSDFFYTKRGGRVAKHFRFRSAFRSGCEAPSSAYTPALVGLVRRLLGS